MSNENENKNKSNCYFFVKFILIIIIFCNISISSLAINDEMNNCNMKDQYSYIKNAFYGTIASISALIILGLLFIFDIEGKNTFFTILKNICALVIIGSFINELYWLGSLFDKYPKYYILFFNNFWTKLKSDCVTGDKVWAYHMMDVILKITSAGLFIVCLIFALFIFCMGCGYICNRDTRTEVTFNSPLSIV